MSSRSSISVLAQALAEKSGLKLADAESFVRQMFDVASTSLETDKLLKIRWLGTFKVMTVKDRESIDVNTGERIVIGGREKISFTPDSILKEIVNKPFSQFETVVVNDGVDFSEIDQKFSSEDTVGDLESNDEEEAATEAVTPVAEAVTPVAEAVAPVTEAVAPVAVETPSRRSGIDFTVEEEPDDRNAADMVPTPASKNIVDYATDEVIVLPGSIVSDKKNDGQDAAADKVVVKDAAVLQEQQKPLVSGQSVLLEQSVLGEQPEPPQTQESAEQVVPSEVQPCRESSPADADAGSDAAVPVEAVAVADIPERHDDGKDTPESSSPAEEAHDEARETVTDDIYDDAADNKRYFSMPRWVVPVSAAVLVVLLAGIGWICFSYGKMKTERNLLASQLKVYETARHRVAAKAKPRDIQADEIRRKSQEDSARMAKASEAVAQAEKAEIKEADSEKNGTQPSADKAKADADAKNVSQKQRGAGQAAGNAGKSESTAKTATKQEQEKEKSSDSQLSAKYDSDPRVRTGAYRIVGVAKTVEVKKGQTLQSLSRVYLGEGMECYVEAINGTRTLKPGQKLKIPQLQLKKKKK